jgi:hypothetical protein
MGVQLQEERVDKGFQMLSQIVSYLCRGLLAFEIQVIIHSRRPPGRFDRDRPILTQKVFFFNPHPKIRDDSCL